MAPSLLLQLEPERVGRGLAGAGPGFPRLRPLALHGRGKALRVDAKPARFQRVLGQVVGKAVSVVELEGDLAGERVAALQPLGRVVEQAKPALERLAEAGLLQLQRLLDQALAALELVIGAAHLPDQRRHQAIEQRLLGAEDMRMPHGAPHDAAKHVAPALVRRQHAVGDEEGRGAQMVGDDAVARRMRRRSPARRSDRPRPRSARGTDRWRSCRGCLAAPRRCARAPCRYRSKAWAGRCARRREAARIA